jgi:hypothetical protein
MIGNTIYDLFWNKYINERYNIQNKKVTLYVNITPPDFIQFEFNKFVTVDNQLFMINKIYDYDLNSNGLTKVDLIQITDISAYTRGSEIFPQFVLSPGLSITGTTSQGVSGSASIINRTSNPNGRWSNLRGEFITFNNTNITSSSNPLNYIKLQSTNYNSETCEDQAVIKWDNIGGCVFNGRISYEIDDEVYNIPIYLNFTRGGGTPDPDPDPDPDLSITLYPEGINNSLTEGVITMSANITGGSDIYDSGVWELSGSFTDSNGDKLDSYSQYIRLHNPGGSVSSGQETIDLM